MSDESGDDGVADHGGDWSPDAVDDDLPAELEGVVADLRQAFLVEPDPAVERAHLAAMALASATGRDRGSLAPAAAVGAGRKAAVAIGVAGVLVLGSAGLAAAGALPAPVQNAAHRLVAPIGIDLPTKPDADGPASTSADPTTTTVPDPTASAEPGAQGVAPGQGGTNPGVGGGEPPGLIADGGSVPTDPGASGAAPGQGGVNPGVGGGEPPGQVIDPGNGDGGGNGGKSFVNGGKGADTMRPGQCVNAGWGGFGPSAPFFFGAATALIAAVAMWAWKPAAESVDSF